MKRSLQVTALWLLAAVAFIGFPATVQAQVSDDYQPGPSNIKVELSIVQQSIAAHSAVIHEHVLKAVSKSGFSSPFTIRTSNTTCANKRSVDLDRQVFLAANPEQGGAELALTLPSNGAQEFVVKTTRPDNTPLNSFNCTQVQAFDLRGKPVSNIVLIESYIPDPKDFR